MRFMFLAVAAALAAATSAASAQSLLERGDYLVNAVMACDGCHSMRGPNGFVAATRFSGGPQTWDTPAYTVKGSNITPDRETGIGTWSAEDLKRSLTQGVRPSGVPLAPQMPFAFYKILTPGDLDAVATYVRSVPPVRNEVQTPSYKTEMHIDLVPGGERSLDATALGDSVKRGFYLATIAHCMECHGKRPDGALDFKSRHGKGGYEMKGPFGSVIVANITSHPTKGIGNWTDAEIKRALTHDVSRDGRPFKMPMARGIYYGRMTDADLNALVAWVRTLSPLE